MSSERKFHDTDSRPCSPSSSPMPTSSDSGATMIRSGSNTPGCTTGCDMPETNSGARQCSTSTEAPAIPRLADHVSAPGYTARLSALVERIAGAADQPALLALFQACVHAMGAQNAVFISIVRDSADVSACRFMLACDPQWCRRYLDAGCIVHDPWLAYAAHHGEPIVASALQVTEPEGRRAIELALQNGFASAALVPAHSGAGHSRISLLCLGSPQAGYFEAEGFGRFRLGARLLAAEIHDWWLALIRRGLVLKALITTEDL